MTICEKEFAENLSDSTEIFVSFSGCIQHLVIQLEVVTFCSCLEAYGTGIAGLASCSYSLAFHDIAKVSGYWQTYGEGRVNHTSSGNVSFIPGCSLTGEVHSNRFGLGSLNPISCCLYNFCCNL